MSILGILDKTLNIFQKPLKLKLDPSLRIERRLEAIEKERKALCAKPHSTDNARRIDALDAERKQLLKEQSRLAARA